MKEVLKGWLIDNAVTTDNKTDKILLLVSTGSLILETEDKKTGLKDGSATAGRNFFVRGAMLKVVGDDESVGVTLTNAAKAVTKLTDDLITINNPSSITLLLPTDLEEGEYTLTVTTQYSAASRFLKTPRSVSTQIWIGDNPASGGGDSKSPDEI